MRLQEAESAQKMMGGEEERENTNEQRGGVMGLRAGENMKCMGGCEEMKETCGGGELEHFTRLSLINLSSTCSLIQQFSHLPSLSYCLV